MKIAYTIQNVGGIDLSQDIGDAVPVKQSIFGLQQQGHNVDCLLLSDQTVHCIPDLNDLSSSTFIRTGLSSTPVFGLFERTIRKIQQLTRFPYFAFFDSFRFFEACQAAPADYDLYHEHNGLLSIGTALACKRSGKPYILTFSADPFLEYELLGKPLRGIRNVVARYEMRFTFQQARFILCVSEAAKAHLISVWQVAPERIVVMQNGVDVSLFAPSTKRDAVRRSLGFSEQFVIGFTGSFQHWHGLDKLVDSFARLRTNIPQAHLLLVGDGPARPDLEAKIDRLGLQECSTITGYVAQTQVPDMLAVMDVVTAPYPQLPQELWFSPLKLFEYMAAGKAIVASKAGQISTVIDHRHTGLLVEPGNIDELASSILYLYQNPDQRLKMGSNARKQAVAHHSWEQYVQRLEEVYHHALAH